jgi:hypothetical protein
MIKEHFKGIGKVIEECGEVQQLAGKAVAFPVGPHPDGNGEIFGRLILECADLYAALDYFVSVNGLSGVVMEQRRSEKLHAFYRWDLNGIIKP